MFFNRCCSASFLSRIRDFSSSFFSFYFYRKASLLVASFSSLCLSCETPLFLDAPRVEDGPLDARLNKLGFVYYGPLAAPVGGFNERTAVGGFKPYFALVSLSSTACLFIIDSFNYFYSSRSVFTIDDNSVIWLFYLSVNCPF